MAGAFAHAGRERPELARLGLQSGAATSNRPMPNMSEGAREIPPLDRAGLIVFRQDSPSHLPWLLASMGGVALGAFLVQWPELISERYQAVIPYPAAALFFLGIAPSIVVFWRLLIYGRPAMRVDPHGFSYVAYGARQEFRWDQVGVFKLAERSNHDAMVVEFEVASARKKRAFADNEDMPETLPSLADIGLESLCRFMNEYRTEALSRTGTPEPAHD